MRISAQDPTKLTILGQPISVRGEFPNTVAASAKNKLVCVGSTGAIAGISCSSFSESGLSPMDELREFDIGQRTPPIGPTNTVSQTFFSHDESFLFTTVKGDPAVNKTGFLSTFPVSRNSCNSTSAVLSRSETRSSPQDTAVLFGSANIPWTNNVFVTDASFGAAILSFDRTQGIASLVSKQAIEGQMATCWATVSSFTKTAFVTDVGTNRIVEMSLKDAHIISQVDLSQNGDPGLIDLRAAGEFLYALSPGNGTTQAAVTVVKVSGGSVAPQMVQHFKLGAMGVGKNAQGMAVFQ